MYSVTREAMLCRLLSMHSETRATPEEGTGNRQPQTVFSSHVTIFHPKCYKN
jgi:hypothetical protein